VTRALDRDDEERRCIIDDGLWAAACNRARARAREIPAQPDYMRVHRRVLTTI